MPTETVAAPSIEQAFDDAIEEHSPAGEQADGQDEALETEAADETEEAPSQSDDSDKAAEQTDETAEEKLLSDEQIDALKGDPAKLVKEMNRAFTQKSQALAAERKQVAADLEIVNEYRRDPKGTVLRLAESLGIKAQPAEAATAERREEKVADVTAELVAEMKASLGPELEFLADKLAPAFNSLARRVAETVVSNEVKPLKEAHQQQIAETAAKQTEAVLEKFTAKYPEWKKHEKAMTEIGARLMPNGMDESEYLETLYNLATRNISDADKTRKVIDKINKSAKAAEFAATGVNENRVSAKAPKGGSLSKAMNTAFEAAERGERFER